MQEEDESEEGQPSDVMREFLKKKPSQGDDLLTLVLEAGRISASASAKSLRVSEDIVTSWAKVLIDEGWFKKTDKDLNDPVYELSESTIRRLRALERDFIESVESVKIEEEEEKKKKVKESLHITPPASVSIVDALVFFSLVLSAVMFNKYLENTTDMIFLLFGLLLIVFSSIIYKKSKQYSIIHMMVYWIKNSKTVALQNKKHLMSFAFILGFIYFLGNFIMQQRSYQLIGAIVSFSLMPFVYRRNRSKSKIIRLYFGMVLIVYALLLLFGFTSATQLIWREIRVFDILIAIILLINLKIRERYFGLRIKSHRMFFKRSGEEAQAEIPLPPEALAQPPPSSQQPDDKLPPKIE